MERDVSFGFQTREKNMKKTRIVSSCLCLALLVGMLAGCSDTEKNKIVQNRDDEIHIPVIFTVYPQNGQRNNEELVESFNKEYQGQYQVDVEWIMETEEEYRQNLKRQNVTDTMPAVITDLRLLPTFYEMMIEDERIMDLSSYIMNDQEWMDMIEPAVLESFTEEDGSIYLAPLSTAIASCSGMFWNKELFEEAGIESFPETWEEFWECCDTLQEHGITPLALHTEGTAWAPMLIATAALADTEDGAEFMKKLFPESYQNESGIMLAETIKKLFSYTTEDAIHSDFDVAFDNFFSGKAAMIPNGYWMIEQIPNEWKTKVKFSTYPGNKLVSSPETFGWAVVDSYSDEVKEGAIEFLKYRTEYNKKEKEKLMATGGRGAVTALQDYVNAYSGNPQIVPNYQTKWNSTFQEKTLGECLPDLVNGKMTVKQFLKEADKSIKQYSDEQ